jgi:large subunit ribosomal protein L23
MLTVCRWDKSSWDAAQERQAELDEAIGPNAGRMPKADRKSIAEQAKALLEGKDKWRPSWMEYGLVREVEVEEDVHGFGV